MLSNYKEKRIVGGWHPYIKEKLDSERLRDTFIWISVAIEKYNIQEEIPRGVFEDISLYL